MDNDLKHALGDRPNSEFVVDPDGKIVVKRSWSDPQQLRRDLEKLVGKSESTTTVADLGYKIQPRPKQAARNVVKRIDVPTGMIALKSKIVSVEGVSASEGEVSYFVKLRAEADQALLETGSGRLYLAFHIDPIYEVHWNNDASPLSYQLKLPEGVQSEHDEGTGPQVKVSADVDPREFLIDIASEAPIEKPIQVNARFIICDDDETFCLPVTEVFQVYLQKDPEAGRRAGGRSGRQGGRMRADMVQRMMQRDVNRDGKISWEEMPERLRNRFEQMDTNNDGMVDQSELQAVERRRRGGG